MAITKPPPLSGKSGQNKSVEKFIRNKEGSVETVQISLQMPASLLNAINSRAKELSISRAAFIKLSCSKFLETQ